MQVPPPVRPAAIITNTLGALSLVADRDALSVSELAEHLQLHERNALRLLLSLEVSGYATRVGDGVYAAGPALADLQTGHGA